MREMTCHGNYFDLPGENESCTVTTNGILKYNGNLVMGAGIAKAAAERYPELPEVLGKFVHKSGNHVYAVQTAKGQMIFSFPTKHHWKDPSDLGLILRSAKELVQLADYYQLTTVYSVRPGCSNGKLDWESQVREPLSRILDDRFIIVSKE